MKGKFRFPPKVDTNGICSVFIYIGLRLHRGIAAAAVVGPGSCAARVGPDHDCEDVQWRGHHGEEQGRGGGGEDCRGH